MEQFISTYLEEHVVGMLPPTYNVDSKMSTT